jgi:hypothetical protein
VLVMTLQSRSSSLSEGQNKSAKEGVSNESLKDVYAVRARGGTGFNKADESEFERNVDGLMRAGVMGVFVEGTVHGVANGMVYFA